MRSCRLYGIAVTVMTAAASLGAPPSGSSASLTEAEMTEAITSALSEIPKLSAEKKHDWMKLPEEYLPAADSLTRYTGLSDVDFQIVAKELGVEIAAIKAVVEIEAGKEMKGFWAPGVPIINFDRTMFTRFRPKSTSKGEAQKVPSGLSGYGLKEWTQLVNARKINRDAADMGTFWGMFQIGGFNYRTCGCSSVREMVERMSYSNLEQLELFAAFITNSGMLPDLRSRNWSAFARKYNGPSYAKRGYHTRMANAYARYKK